MEAKKNRKLSVELERERNRCAQIQIESDKLKSGLATFSHKSSPKKMKPNTNTNTKTKTNIEHDAIVNKLKQKVIRSQSETLQCKDIIKKLNIALKKEIGDDTKI
eukprot:TRINITY_DN1829_c0_g1_i1.p1 TRINITY_DN1829_c0_g1~~TRINITY_DN1829_c0_g1_i1.p1  ORF type:complete len:105 (-),score=29.51 TRINITY_DN1829_c0_g1_i1:21-335(-)